jgi:hypothetical protein
LQVALSSEPPSSSKKQKAAEVAALDEVLAHETLLVRRRGSFLSSIKPED